jgi:hypothetical protein
MPSMIVPSDANRARRRECAVTAVLMKQLDYLVRIRNLYHMTEPSKGSLMQPRCYLWYSFRNELPGRRVPSLDLHSGED